MKYTIEYEKVVRKINSVTIEVDDDDEGDEIADELYEKQREFEHPDDILAALSDMGVKIIDVYEGAESCDYEVQ